MSAALFDLALRVCARDVGAAVPRLLHNPAPKREVTVAVSARRAGGAIRVQAIGPQRAGRNRQWRCRFGGDSACGRLC